MTIYFAKIKNMLNEDHILVFKQGEFGTPILTLDKKAIKDLNEEWERKE